MATVFKQVKNNAKGVLNTTLLLAGVAAVLQSGQGSKFPATAAGSFWATIWDSGTYSDPGDDPNMEVVLVTTRSTDTLTITRAQLGTAAVQHAAGSRVALLLIDQSLIDIHTAINTAEAAITTILGSAATLTGAETLTNKVVSDLFMGNTFQSRSATARSATLPASSLMVSQDNAVIGATASLEIPATTSLEIFPVASLSASERLSNKTLVSPKIVTSINDTNGNEVIKTPATAAAVNEVTVTNAATGSSPSVAATGDDTNINLALLGKGNGLVKFSVLRQDNTTDGYQAGNTVTLTGWGVVVPGASNTGTKTVTFGVTFTQRPIVLISSGGDNLAGALTLGASTSATLEKIFVSQSESVTTTSFVARVRTIDGSNWTAGTSVFYHWRVTGEIA